MAVIDKPLISVVVCTYNRCSLLKDCLESLADQALDKQMYEVIIVNNNSTDDTQKIAEKFTQKEPNFRVVIETNQGVSYSRNRGWKESIGEYVAYSDDECRIPEKWLSEAKDIIENISPDIFGGPFFAFYNEPKPNWFKDEYGSHEQGNQAKILNEHEFLDGCNIFFRADLFKTLAGFDPELGMTGQKMAYGEETALQIAVRKRMPDKIIYYDPQLFVYHLVRKEKMNLYYIAKMYFLSGCYSYLVFRDKRPHTIVAIGHSIGMSVMVIPFLIALMIVGLVIRDRSKYPFAKNYLIECVYPQLQTLGTLFEEFRSNIGGPNHSL